MIDRPDTPGMPAPSHGVYGITVAAELSGIPVQSLRLYERHGLLTPERSPGGTRRYSADDLARLQRISELLTARVNLTDNARIFSLEDRNAALDDRNVALEGDNASLRAANPRRKSANRRSASPSPDTDPSQNNPST